MTSQTPFPPIGKYQILEKIGEGGFGIVYRGQEPMLDRDVAIKVLRADVAASPDFIERFRREARLAAALRHPNIVNVIEVGEQGGRYYLVMEYLPGQSLADVLRDGKPLSLARSLELLQPLADALDYAHGMNIIHRDIKPSNVILADGGKRPVITDFGLGKALNPVDSGNADSLTFTGVVMGTAYYMAPEQILNKTPGAATDLYALGVMTFQMLTGHLPFEGTTPYEIQRGHVEQTPPNPRLFNPTLSQDVTEVIWRALEKEPSKRFPNALNFVEELRRTYNRGSAVDIRAVLQEAQKRMDNLEFDSAITRLTQTQALTSNSQVNNLLGECQRRKEIWVELQDLRNQQEQLDSKLNHISNTEKWISSRQTKKVPESERSKKPLRMNKQFSERKLLILLILLALVGLLLLIISGGNTFMIIVFLLWEISIIVISIVIKLRENGKSKTAR